MKTNTEKTLTFDELLQHGYQILSWSDTRLAVLTPDNQYEVWKLTKDDRWTFFQREHSF